MLLESPFNTIFGLKSLIGCTEHSQPTLHAHGQILNRPFEEIQAIVLQEAMRQAEKELGKPIQNAVMSVQKHFNDM